MKKEYSVCPKDEAYSYDELCFLREAVSNSDLESREGLVQKINLLTGGLKENTEGSAIFFMPKSSFDIFSIFQGDNSLCEIDAADLRGIKAALSSYSAGQEEIKQFEISKVIVLEEYIKSGNQVKPVVIQSDNSIKK